MKNRIKKHNGIRGLIMTGALLVFLSGCSTTHGLFSWLPFSDYSNIKHGISNKEIEEFGVSIRPASGNPDSHYLLAKYYQERGRHKDAIAELKKTISINSAYVKAYNRIGISYDTLGDFPRAVLYYKNALALNAELDYVLNNLGYSYILQGKYDKAIKVLNKAVELNKKEHLYHNNLRLAYAKNDKFEKATDEVKLAGNRAVTHSKFKRMLSEKNSALVAEKDSIYDASFVPSLKTIHTRIDSKKAIHEAKHYRRSKKIIPSNKKKLKLVFGKPIFGPDSRHERPKIVFGKPIFGPSLRHERSKIVFGRPIFDPDLISTEEGETSERQVFGWLSYVRKFF